MNKTHHWKEQTNFSKCNNFQSQIKVQWSAIILKVVIFIRICLVNGQGLPVQLICHTKPYNNLNFQIDGASRYFGVWVWQLVHLLILVCSFQWCVLFLSLAKFYRSCPISDKGLLCMKPRCKYHVHVCVCVQTEVDTTESSHLLIQDLSVTYNS